MDLDRSGWNWCICRVCISMFSMRQKFHKLPLPEMFKAVQYSSNKDAKFCQVALTEQNKPCQSHLATSVATEFVCRKMPLSIQSAAQLQQKMTTGTNFQDHGLLMVSIAGKIRSSAGSLVPKPVTIDCDKHIMQALLHRIYMVGTWYHNIFWCLSASGVPRFVAFDPGSTFNLTSSLL